MMHSLTAFINAGRTRFKTCGGLALAVSCLVGCHSEPGGREWLERVDDNMFQNPVTVVGTWFRHEKLDVDYYSGGVHGEGAHVWYNLSVQGNDDLLIEIVDPFKYEAPSLTLLVRRYANTARALVVETGAVDSTQQISYLASNLSRDALYQLMPMKSKTYLQRSYNIVLDLTQVGELAPRNILQLDATE